MPTPPTDLIVTMESGFITVVGIPDRKIRLFDRRKGGWTDDSVHEAIKMNDGATISHLRGDLLHYSHPTVSDHLKKIDHYSTMANPKKVGCCALVVRPLWRFFWSYFVRKGFLDGKQGLSICLIESLGVF